MVKLTSFNCLKSGRKQKVTCTNHFDCFFFPLVLFDSFAFIISLTHNQMLEEKNHIHTKKDATTHLQLETS
jgi:hypothetical protein